MTLERTQEALAQALSAEEVAKAATKDAIATNPSAADALAFARELYKEATGRFPQDSSDRRMVYVGSIVLVGIVFVVALAAGVLIPLTGQPIPDWISTLATAICSGVLGGIFGYSRQ